MPRKKIDPHGYQGLLAKPIKARWIWVDDGARPSKGLLGLGTGRREIDWENSKPHYLERVKALFEHFGLDVADADPANHWCQLALTLAEKHIPGFALKEAKPRNKPGPKDVWTEENLFRLWADVEARIDEMGDSTSSASRPDRMVARVCRWFSDGKSEAGKARWSAFGAKNLGNQYSVADTMIRERNWKQGGTREFSFFGSREAPPVFDTRRWIIGRYALNPPDNNPYVRKPYSLLGLAG
ncbi:hypothetical protein [Dongia mobilis]|uniref:hypothetical protein n=1 Tax=Dongia sp. TaxID=1977262 RepID=UPI0026F1D0E6